jgi:hypothetical protein
MVFKYR